MAGIIRKERLQFFSVATVLISAGLSCFQPQADEGETHTKVVNKGLELFVTPDQKVFAQGGALAFKVTVKNVSKKPFRLVEIAKVVESTFSDQRVKFKYGGYIGDEFHEQAGLSIRLSSARGNGAPPPGEDVPSKELKPGESTTFDLDLDTRTHVFADLKSDPLRTLKQLPSGQYQATLKFHFRYPQILKNGKFVEQPDPSYWAGDVKVSSVTFQIAK